MNEIIEQKDDCCDEIDMSADDILSQLKELQKAMINYAQNRNCVNHVFLHEATNRLKESGFWFDELVNNREGL